MRHTRTRSSSNPAQHRNRNHLEGEHTREGEHTHEEADGTFKAAVFGFSDGLCTNVNLVLGVYMAALAHSGDPYEVNRLVTMTGLAGLFAGASSMASGEWLSAQAEDDQEQRELAHEAWHHEHMPEAEDRHMKEILTEAGLSDAVADAVNRDVRKLPLQRQVDFHARFEMGIEVNGSDSPLKNAACMWLCFAFGALLPVLPWWLTASHRLAFMGTVIATIAGVGLTSVYQVRGHWTALPKTLVRQLIVTAIAVGVTVGFNVLFTKSG
eukprot:g1085.t1